MTTENEKKVLRRSVPTLFYYVDGEKIAGANPDLKGDVSGLWGDTTGLWGDVTNLWGNVTNLAGYVNGLRGDATGLSGNVTGLWGDLNGISEEDKTENPDINSYVK